MVTLKEIASNLDLSVMAVSKALRDASDIGASTKDRVRMEALRLGYVPNRQARTLRAGSSQLIGCILPSLQDPFCMNIAQGLEERASGNDIEMLITSSHGNADLELKALNRMLERQVEAIFIFPVARLQHRSPILDLASHHRVPIFFVGQYPASLPAGERVGWVVADNQKAGRLGAEFLIGRGHTQILYLSGPLASSSASEHFIGYKEALHEAGIEFTDARVFFGGLTMEGGEEAVHRALQEKIPFTAILAPNDAVVAGAINKLTHQGVRVPGEISVVGFGDGALAAHFQVPLTTVRQPQIEMGREAFHLFHRMKSGDTTQTYKVLPVEMIIRRSVGPLLAQPNDLRRLSKHILP